MTQKHDFTEEERESLEDALLDEAAYELMVELEEGTEEDGSGVTGDGPKKLDVDPDATNSPTGHTSNAEPASPDAAATASDSSGSTANPVEPAGVSPTPGENSGGHGERAKPNGTSGSNDSSGSNQPPQDPPPVTTGGGEDGTPEPLNFWAAVLMILLISVMGIYFFFIRNSNSTENTIWAIGVFLVGMITLIGMVAMTAYTLAFFNIFFTFVSEGQYKVLRKGETYYGAVGSVHMHAVNPRTGEIRKLQPGEKDPYLSFADELFGLLGIRWIGIWPFITVYKYPFKWIQVLFTSTGELSGGFEVKKRDEVVGSIFHLYTYAARIIGAESKENIPFDLVLAVTTKVINVRSALFSIPSKDGWLNRVLADVHSAVRQRVKTLTVDELFKTVRGTSNPDDLLGFESELIEFISKGGPRTPGTIGLVGVEVIGIKVLSVTASGTNSDEITKALEATKIAQENGRATVAAAEAQATATRLAADASAYTIITEADAQGHRVDRVLSPALQLPGGANVFVAEAQRDAIKGSKAQTLVLGGTSPGLMIPPSPPSVTEQSPQGEPKKQAG